MHDKDCDAGAGATAPSWMSSAVRRALESSDCAASIFAERVIRDGIDMVEVDMFSVRYLMLEAETAACDVVL